MRREVHAGDGARRGPHKLQIQPSIAIGVPLVGCGFAGGGRVLLNVSHTQSVLLIMKNVQWLGPRRGTDGVDGSGRSSGMITARQAPLAGANRLGEAATSIVRRSVSAQQGDSLGSEAA